MAAICRFQNAFPSAVGLPALLPPGLKLSHATEAVITNIQGFSLSVPAGEAVHLAISLSVMGEAV